MLHHVAGSASEVWVVGIVGFVDIVHWWLGFSHEKSWHREAFPALSGGPADMLMIRLG